MTHLIADDSSVCRNCVFCSPQERTCDVDIVGKYLSLKRVPYACPRGLTPKSDYKNYKFFSYAFLGELEHNGGRMTFGRICDLFPFLSPWAVLKILKKLRREGKISKLRRTLSELDRRNVWKLGNNFRGSSR